MAITTTTLAGAVGKADTVISVAIATGITAPNFQTALGITYLFIDQELMLVVGVNGTFVSVLRAQNGTQANAHVANQTILIGLPTDFPAYVELLGSELIKRATIASFVQPAIVLSGTADVIDPTVPGFYEFKTGSADAATIIAPPSASEGYIYEFVSDTLFAHTITAASALFGNGTALKTIATFPAFRGAYLKLRASNGIYEVLSNGASAGVVVLT